MYSPHLVYGFIPPWTLGLLHVLAIVNNAAVNIGMQISVQDFKKNLNKCALKETATC